MYSEGSGFLKMLTGDLTSARMHFEKALSLYRGVGAESAALATLLNLADVTWALGDLDAALAGLSRGGRTLRKVAARQKGVLGARLTNLAGVHTERGELDEALAAAREGLPLRKEAGHAWVTLDHLALRAALAASLQTPRVSPALRIRHTRQRKRRASPTKRAPTSGCRRCLREKLAPDELERLLAEGAKMSEDEACRLALED